MLAPQKFSIGFVLLMEEPGLELLYGTFSSVHELALLMKDSLIGQNESFPYLWKIFFKFAKKCRFLVDLVLKLKVILVKTFCFFHFRRH